MTEELLSDSYFVGIYTHLYMLVSCILYMLYVKLFKSEVSRNPNYDNQLSPTGIAMNLFKLNLDRVREDKKAFIEFMPEGRYISGLYDIKVSLEIIYTVAIVVLGAFLLESAYLLITTS